MTVQNIREGSLRFSQRDSSYFIVRIWAKDCVMMVLTESARELRSRAARECKAGKCVRVQEHGRRSKTTENV